MPKIQVTGFSARRLVILVLLVVVILVPSSAVTLSTLHNFTDLADGGFPEAGVVLSSSGVLYGTTYSGGAWGWGTVYQLSPGTGGVWTQTTLYNFTGGSDGATPVSDLIIGTNNVLYGTTYYGGAHGYGTVFQLTAGTGGSWTEKVLYSFAGGRDGANPASGVVLSASTGVLYGTTYLGGSSGNGTIYQLGPGQGGTWTEKVLYAFLGGTDGANPVADLVLSSASSILYGTTSQGGTVTNSTGTYSNWGTVFQLAPAGGGVWHETLLYTFTGGADGGTPESALLIGPSSILYGTTFWGGSATGCPVGGYPQGCGTVFQLQPAGGGVWNQTVLYTFTGANKDGSHPYRNLVRNGNTGVLVGTTYSGGASTNICFPQSYAGCGTVFTVKPSSPPGGPWTKTNLAVFLGSNGGAPNGAVLSKTGVVYGTTLMGGSSNGFGTVFQVAP